MVRGSMVKLARRIQRILGRDVVSILWERAAEDSADYVEQYLAEAMVFESVPEVWDYAIQKTRDRSEGIALEFGVFAGTSINYFSRHLPRLSFYGFDSFEGLAEDWHGHMKGRGGFNRDGSLPSVNRNVTLIKGWFDQTLPEFAGSKLGGRELALLHIDSDTYNSAKTVLCELKSHIKPGLHVLFDEYLGYPNWRNGEFLAWQEFCQSNGIRYRYLAFCHTQALIEVI